MTMIRLARSASLLGAGLLSLLASACATGDLLTNRGEPGGVPYDAQECVEHALRSEPDPATVRDAVVAFTGACQAGEAASCSALGVMYELGRGVPASVPRALSLYGSACEAHNLRACANLRSLAQSEASATRATATLANR
jgi:TPR repeat protein